MTGTLWLTLGEASRMLGVDPDTLRRWADNGKVDVLKTPGGHRRFLRESIEEMLPRPRRSLSAIGEAPDRIAAEFRKRVRSDLETQDWTRHFDETSLRWFRERGMRMSDLLIRHLDAGARPGREPQLEQATALGRDYGVQARRQGLSLGEATQAFLFFRARFLAEIANVARRRSLEPKPAAVLFAEADRALDAVILALIDGHRGTGAA
ncbi:MAG TPA: helix-turn-helix domain-containing protein [Candidatus Saccharimonadales bacterium]|nr:helix-turn-helix domain-containing protein [Candidatus Saccharimonadales bacterium]